MTYPWIDDYCSGKPGCKKDYQEEWGAFRYMLEGKMFAMTGTDKDKRKIITLKLDPEFGSLLREQYPDIRPGYYMNKIHWNSIDLNGSVPDDVLKKMVDESHGLIFASLPKKIQKSILEVST